MKNIVDEIYFNLKFYQTSGIDVFFEQLPNNFYAISDEFQEEVKFSLTENDVKDKSPKNSENFLEKNVVQQNLYATNVARDVACDIANSSDNLEILKAKVVNSNFCQLKKYAMNTVFGCGVEKNPDVMIIGEAPGADEDKQGIPFVGVSGQLLDKIFASVGIDRKQNAYISNVLKWRPPGNRTPTPEECFICMPILKRQIELVNPKVIVLAGSVAVRAVLNNTDGITKIRGFTFEYKCCDKFIKTIPMFHPSYLLRNPTSKKLAYLDALHIRKLIQSTN